MTIKNNQLEDSPRKQTKVSSDPDVSADQGAFFTKEVSGVVEGFFVDSAGRTIQITEDGKVKVNPSSVGEVNTSSNAGSVGEGLAKAKVGTDLPFKRILAGSNITLIPYDNYVLINAAFPPSSGEANTASNVGLSGVGLFKQKTGVNLEFKRLKAGNNVIIAATPNDEVEISVAGGGGGGGGEANTASNLGSSLNGYGLYSSKVGVDLQFKRIKAGANVTITDEGTDLLIAASGGGGGGGSGDMLKATYDANDNGVVDNSERLNSQLPSYYLDRTNHTGTQSAATISGLASVATIGTLDSLGDVTAPSPTIGQYLQWNGTAWIPATLAGGSGDMLKSTYDTTNNGIVDNSEKLNNQLPSFYLSRSNHTGSQSAATITGLSTVATTGSYNDLLNKPTIPTNLDSLTDVTAPSPTNGQVLQWNGTAWVNATVAGTGDMLKATYDSNDNGIVDNSERLNSQLPSYYLSRTNHTGTQSAATITGLASVATVGTLDSLSDVTAPSPSSGQVLQWNGSAWVSATVSGGGASTLNDLTDVTISGTPSNAQFLRYNSGTSQWENQSVTIPSNIDSLTDVTISGTPSNNQFLRYNSTSSQWENQTVSIPTNLDSLTDVVITGTPSTGQVLKYDGSNWVNGTVSGGGGGLARYQAYSTSGEEVWVLATDTGITYSRVGTTGTFSIPAGVQLISARLRLPMGTIGGTSFTVAYGSGSGNGAGDNTSAADAWRPNFTVWREDTGAQVAASSVVSSGFDRIQFNSLTTGQTCVVKLTW